DPSISASADLTTLAVGANVTTLLVDDDDNAPNVQAAYSTALTANSVVFNTWDLKQNNVLPRNYTLAYKNVVWFTGNSYPAPVVPYEPVLKAFLDNGGRLLMSGQDILDQAAGTTPFVHDYLHITWDGSEAQNDKPTAPVMGVTGNPVSNGIGPVPIDHTVLGAQFEDQLTPNGTATGTFTDNPVVHNYAVNFANATYKTVFLGFPLEAYGTAAQKADLVARSFA